MSMPETGGRQQYASRSIPQPKQRRKWIHTMYVGVLVYGTANGALMYFFLEDPVHRVVGGFLAIQTLLLAMLLEYMRWSDQALGRWATRAHDDGASPSPPSQSSSQND